MAVVWFQCILSVWEHLLVIMNLSNNLPQYAILENEYGMKKIGYCWESMRKLVKVWESVLKVEGTRQCIKFWTSIKKLSNFVKKKTCEKNKKRRRGSGGLLCRCQKKYISVIPMLRVRFWKGFVVGLHFQLMPVGPLNNLVYFANFN